MPQDRLAIAVLRPTSSQTLKAAFWALSSLQTSRHHGFWLAQVMVLVSMTSSMDLLMLIVTVSVLKAGGPVQVAAEVMLVLGTEVVEQPSRGATGGGAARQRWQCGGIHCRDGGGSCRVRHLSLPSHPEDCWIKESIWRHLEPGPNPDQNLMESNFGQDPALLKPL